MTKLVTTGLDLLNYVDAKDTIRYKLAGLIIFDCLIDVSDEIVPERRIEIANHICKVLENDKIPITANEIILRTAALSIGHFARVASNTEAEFLQNYYYPLAQKLVTDSRSDCHRLAGVLIFAQLAQNVPTLIFSKRKILFNALWDVITDHNRVIREAAAVAFESSLQVISQRESMADYVKASLRQIENGLNAGVSDKILGALLIFEVFLNGNVINLTDLQLLVRDQVQEVIWKVFQRKDSRDAEVKHRIIEILPKIANAFSGTFLQPNPYSTPNNFLGFSLKYLLETIAARKDRQVAYLSLGKLFLALSTYFRSYTNISDIFQTILVGFRDPFCREALSCLGMFITTCTASRKFIDEKVINTIFTGGLTEDLVETLKTVIKYVPAVRPYTQRLLRENIQSILSNHVVNIDDATVGRAMSVRLYRAQSPPITQRDNKGYLWNSSGHGIFGSAAKQELDVTSSPLLSATALKSDDLLMFALRTLSIPDFFPKQQRERVSNVIDDDQTRDLLGIVRDLVLRYTDDFSPLTRRAAAQACASVVDSIIPIVETQSHDFSMICQILDRLLIMGVGDENEDIRVMVFDSFSPSMDLALSLTDNVHCLIEALNDEVLQVRAAAMTVLSRIAHFDTLHVMPFVRLTLQRLIYTLNTTTDPRLKQESVHILQSLVRGSESLIVPYVKQIIGPLMALLSEPTTDVVISALSTVGELAIASPASVREHLDELAPRLIEALNDQSSLAKQKTAVVAMGKLVSSLTMVTDEPFKKYAGLFDGLVRAMRSVGDSSSELRLQAIKTLGLLGVVDISVYQKYLSNSTGSIVLQTDDVTNDTDKDNNRNTDGEKQLSTIEKYYFSVVIRSLMNVLKDSSLSQYHQTASSLAIRAFRMIGPQAIIQLSELMNGILYRLYQGDAGNSIKENLLDHIISIVQIVGKYVRRFNQQLLGVLNHFFDNHMILCLDIFEALSVVLSTPDFGVILQGFIPTLKRVVDDECGLEVQSTGSDPHGVGESLSSNAPSYMKTSSSAAVPSKPSIQPYLSSSGRAATGPLSKTAKIFQKIVNVGDSFGEFRRYIIPMIINVLDKVSLTAELRRVALCTVMNLSNESDFREFAARIVHSLLRFLNVAEGAILSAIFTSFSTLVCRLGTGFIPFIIPIRRKLKSLMQREGFVRTPKLEEYESLVGRLLKERPLPNDPSDTSDIMMSVDGRVRARASTARVPLETNFQINVQALETAWALADRNNSNNFIDWMRRLMVELIRQSPSPIIRLCATLAKNHRPLAEELFNISFHSVWEELYGAQIHDVIIDIPLINGIEVALQSMHSPKNIVISLLNLVEFMEVQDKPLPVDVVLIARQAQAANMFAKSLRYREIEFSSKVLKPSFDCIDALITVNNQLGLSDRAIGILRSIKQRFQDIDIQPQWLEKLCRWDDAHKAYEYGIKQMRELNYEVGPRISDDWLGHELGRLRCLRAIADYEELEHRSKHLKEEIKSKDEILHAQALGHIQCLGAKAAWMLGKWDVMEEFVEGEAKVGDSTDVMLEQNLSFYHAILAIHQKDYLRASSLISETRTALSGSINSLLSESYSRAYRAMVAMQILAELDEVVEYKQMTEKLSVDLDAMKTPADEGVKIIAGSELSKYTTVSTDLVTKKADLIRKWRARLKWAPRDIEVYRQILVSIIFSVNFLFCTFHLVLCF